MISACAKDKSGLDLVGQWETDVFLSQLGDSVVRWHFRDDGTFDGYMNLIQVGKKFSDQGEYKTEGNQLILTGRTTKRPGRPFRLKEIRLS